MNTDRYTVKASEALNDAISLAEAENHGQVEEEHLLHALLSQKDGIISPLIEKIGAKPDFQIGRAHV